VVRRSDVGVFPLVETHSRRIGEEPRLFTYLRGFSLSELVREA